MRGLALAVVSVVCGGCTLAGSDANTCTIDGSYLVCSDNPDAPTLVGATDAGPLVAITTEPPGAHCPEGGQKITTTTSLPNGDVSTSVNYVCNGGTPRTLPAQCVQGTDPLSSTAWVMCGMVASEAGLVPLLSTVANGLDSDAGEVTSTIYVDYVCQQLGYASADVVNWNCNNICDTTYDGQICHGHGSTCSSYPTPQLPGYNYYAGGDFLPSDANGRYVDDGSSPPDFGAVWTCK